MFLSQPSNHFKPVQSFGFHNLTKHCLKNHLLFALQPVKFYSTSSSFLYYKTDNHFLHKKNREAVQPLSHLTGVFLQAYLNLRRSESSYPA